jgi:hypothetical protein
VLSSKLQSNRKILPEIIDSFHVIISDVLLLLLLLLPYLPTPVAHGLRRGLAATRGLEYRRGTGFCVRLLTCPWSLYECGKTLQNSSQL